VVSDGCFPDNNAVSTVGDTMAMTNEHFPTVGGMIEWCVGELERGGVFYGHGTDNAVDEAASLIFSVAGLDHAAAAVDPQAVYSRAWPSNLSPVVDGLLRRRIDERIPLPYLLKEAWFADLSFYVDERVLIPRSPFAELIAERFEPWLDPTAVHRILEIGTGSGCIAIALARAFPDSRVVAGDLMANALEVARINLARHAMEGRVELVQSDLYERVEGRFDLIVSNPPYVPLKEVAGLPGEYTHEPGIALASGDDGLDSSRRILQDAARYLTDGGTLALEVGTGAALLEAAFPRLGFVWPELERGGEGLALVSAVDLQGLD
jgi:ribosomal protein L3 glutamine methyltransferase